MVEPTTVLDMVVQREILKQVVNIQSLHGFSADVQQSSRSHTTRKLWGASAAPGSRKRVGE